MVTVLSRLPVNPAGALIATGIGAVLRTAWRTLFRNCWVADSYKSKAIWKHLLSILSSFAFIHLISTSEHMLAHAFAWAKTMKNKRKSWKSTLYIKRTRSSWRKSKFFGQRLGVTPKSWLLISSWALHEPLTHDEKSTFYDFKMFFIVLDACIRCVIK